MAVILKARYAGRVEKTRETLLLVQAQRKKLIDDQASELARTRNELALKLRKLRNNTQRRGLAIAQQRSQRHISQELLKLHAQYRQALRRAQAECLELSLRVAEEVIGTTIPELPAAMSIRISSALSDLRDSRPIQIEVHASDFQEVSRQLASKRTPMQIALRSVEDIDRGKARLMTAAGTIHVDWKEHLDQLKSDLRTAQKNERVKASNS